MAKSPNIGSPGLPCRAESGGSGLASAPQRNVPLLSTQAREGATFALKGSGNRKFTMPVPNSLLEIGGLRRDATGAVCNHACLDSLMSGPPEAFLANALNLGMSRPLLK